MSLPFLYENYEVAQRGGNMAGNARRSFEKTDNVKVVSTNNFLKTGDKTGEMDKIA